MSKSVLQWMEEYIRRAFRSRVWHKFMQMMVCVVVFCTTYALILPALTMEQQYACGAQEHLHGESCYALRTRFSLTCTPESMGLHTHSEGCGDGTSCGYRTVPVHTHENLCYDSEGTLICPLEELAEHVHADGCYEAGPLVCTLEELQGHAHEAACYDAEGNLICTLEEQAGHTHEAACYGPVTLACTREVVQLHIHSDVCRYEDGTLACGLPETVAHQHGEGCVGEISEDKLLICGLEEHTHGSGCSSNPEADVESSEQWVAGLSQVTITGRWADDLAAVARSQLGYQESQQNFLMENGVRKGYTRYGHWFGITYADWDAMFVSFCLRHADIPAEAIDGSAYSDQWLESLREQGLTASLDARFPAAGEIVFFRAEDGAVHSGIINAVDTEAGEDGETRIAQLRVIAGNIDNRVTEAAVAADRVLEVVSLEQALLRYETAPTEAPAEAPTEAPTESEVTLIQSAETENYIVTVSYSADLALPDGAQLRVSEYARDSEIFRQRCEEAGYELEWLLNIGFFLEDTELELDGAFDVQVTSKQGQPLGQNITHFADEGAEQLDAVHAQESQSSVQFAADGFSDFGGGVALAADDPVVYANSGEFIGYTMKTADPNNLREGVDYVIYMHDGGTQTFLGTGPNALVVDSGKWSSPQTIGAEWTVNTSVLGSNLSTFTWRVIKQSDGTYLLYSPYRNRYLHVDYNSVKLTSQVKAYRNTNISGAASRLTHPWGSNDANYLRFSNNNWTGTQSSGSATMIYFAEASNLYRYYPTSVETGNTEVTPFRFYNFLANGEGGVGALGGCVFEVVGENGDTYTLTSSEHEPLMELPATLADGKYTITEVSAPNGYMTDARPTREFEVKDGHLVGTSSIGNFINHEVDHLKAGKTAQVEDYANRIYQVMLDASASIKRYEMEPIDVRFVVDQSNSMLFPSGLTPIGKSVTLSLNGSNNVQNLENLNLDKTKMHYLISDPQGSSTVWALWYDGLNWIYQDSSYYAKADHNNAEGYQQPDGEKAIFPQNRSYSDQANAEADDERSNGGGIGFSLSGSGLGKDIDKASNDQKTFELYYATGPYNRLHYLEQGMAHIISELADANPENVVSLTRFTKEVKEDTDCIPKTELTPDHLNGILDEIDGIETSGGTRQDLALKHVYENPNHEPTAGHPSYTVLITDGAPVISGSPDDLPVPNALGTPEDVASTTTNSVYAQIKGYANLIKSPEGENSTLISIALGMNNVEGGKKVLREIASPGHFYECDDAAGLVDALQELLFAAMKPRETVHARGDVMDEISDSFYPIAWVEQGAGAATGRQVLATSGGKDWILLQENDWINLDGKYTTGTDKAGQLLVNADGDFYVLWKDQPFNDPYIGDTQHIAWVPAGTSHGRTVVRTDSDKEWILLQNGDWISEEGQYQTSAPSRLRQRYYGQYTDGTIAWGSSARDQRILYTPGFEQWNGTVYIKAKEDFIGGNVIDTNKDASVTAYGERVALDSPNVNVRLLDMTDMSTEVTVYKGDPINGDGEYPSPLDSLKHFFSETEFKKLVEGTGTVLNEYADVAGLTASNFDLAYAMNINGVPQPLNAEQWKALANGETVIVPYTYDYDSSHGPVGYFTFSLEKTGDGASYDRHTAEHACDNPVTDVCEAPVETYTLNVTYSAYRMDQAYHQGGEHRPGENEHNGPAGPGQEVGGSGAGETLPEGKGDVEKENIHRVHVIAGSIEIWKEIDDSLISTEADQEFRFTVQTDRVDPITGNPIVLTGSVIIPKGKTTPDSSLIFTNLSRGTYLVTENESDDYVLESLTIGDGTNTESALNDTATQATFVMGNNPGGQNVIGFAQAEDMYTSYTDPVNGIYGQASFVNKKPVYNAEIPVEKAWSGDAEDHTGDVVYVALWSGTAPVRDDLGRVRILRLDAASEWKGVFTVTIPEKDYDVSLLQYTVREIAHVRTEAEPGDQEAILENDGSILYYDHVVEEDGLTGINGRAYIVRYTIGEDGTLTVTNLRAVEMPHTGGMGTQPYTISGTLLLAAALVYGYSQRRKRGRRGSE